ncbi:MAG: 50S ribosomal protein L18 [Rickettsiales bacterium]|nr:50S ribosomal protein L18 [Rickettsiales bacterium]
MANANFNRRKQRTRYQLRKKGGGRVRLSVFRSGSHIYAQLIDDKQGKTLAQASSIDKDLREKVKNGGDRDAAKAVGELIAQRAKEAKVDEVVFDRGGYLFHGRVKALADAAREAGLKF